MTCAGAAGSVLVIDHDLRTRMDRRLIAHIAADEPASNVELICALYLADPEPWRCRRVHHEDMRIAAPTELEGQSEAADGRCAPSAEPADEEAHGDLLDTRGNRYRLTPVSAKLAIPELRWVRMEPGAPGDGAPVSVREVVGALERYEPVRSLTAAAIARHLRDARLSVSTIVVELERLNASRIVLNRGLREAVLWAVGGSELSMSEIALRCGRAKRDRRGGVSGETTWLSRRIGLVCEGGNSAPTPWIRSDVLALIARRGLGIAPREVELA